MLVVVMNYYCCWRYPAAEATAQKYHHYQQALDTN